MCREDDVREVRGLAELILPSQRDAEEGTGGFVLAGSALLGLAASVVGAIRSMSASIRNIAGAAIRMRWPPISRRRTMRAAAAASTHMLG